MKFNVITLFPEMVLQNFTQGVISRAINTDKVKIKCINPRDFTKDVHQSVDDRPYGGGPGMVMRADVMTQAVDMVKSTDLNSRVIALCPRGKRFTHSVAERLSQLNSITLVCGRYEGFDERFISSKVDETLSIGDYVLSGGELGASVVIDSVSRLLSGVLGHNESAQSDSFAMGLLDCSHYTRPERIYGLNVPDVLQSGNHKAILEYRQQQSLGISWEKRPELFSRKRLSIEELQSLNAYIKAKRNF